MKSVITLVLHIAFLRTCEILKVVPKGLRLPRKHAEVPMPGKLNDKWRMRISCLELQLVVDLRKHYEELCFSLPQNRKRYNPPSHKQASIKINKLMVLSELSYNEIHLTFNNEIEEMYYRLTRPRNRRFVRNKPPPIRNTYAVSDEELDRTVVSLSSFQLSREEKLVLNKGIGFAIKPKEFDRYELLTATAKYCNSILQIDQSYATKAYVESIKKDVQAVKVTRTGSNLSKDEFKILKDLRKNDQIVIKPADKGRVVVVWGKNEYVTEAQRQLNVSSTYRLESSDQTVRFKEEIIEELDHLVQQGKLSFDNLNSLKPSDKPRTSLFYMLPKIHKNIQPCPGRPIVSSCASVTEKISSFIDSEIKPLAMQTLSYVKDTTDFINKLNNINGEIQKDHILVVADVSSLYTNIPHKDGLTAMFEALENRENKYPSSDTFVKLAKIVLEKNTFQFNKNFYTQLQGTAMGTKMAPNYAILFMDWLERNLIASSDKKPMVWWRYIDDIFFIWTHGQEALQNFQNHANAFHDSIKFTFEASTTSVNFLDVTITKTENEISTDLYIKPTDTRQFLHYDSCHPIEHRLPIAYSQALRIRRICSDEKRAKFHIQELRHALIRRGYPRGRVQKQIDKALVKDRSELLRRRTTETEEKKVVKFVAPFHPSIYTTLKMIISQHDHFIHSKDISTKLWWKPPKKIKDYLVSSHLKERGAATANNHGIVSPCNNRRCKTCVMLSTDTTITSQTTGISYKISARGTACTSTNIIYGLRFQDCPFIYIGESGRSLRERMTEHRSDVRHESKEKVVSYHCSEHNHKEEDLTVSILKKMNGTEKERKIEELKFISQLMTDWPLGLNMQHVLQRSPIYDPKSPSCL